MYIFCNIFQWYGWYCSQQLHSPSRHSQLPFTSFPILSRTQIFQKHTEFEIVESQYEKILKVSMAYGSRAWKNFVTGIQFSHFSHKCGGSSMLHCTNNPTVERTMLLPMQIGILLTTLILTLPCQHGMKHSSQLGRSSFLQRLSEQ